MLRPAARSLVVLSAALLVLAACAGDDDDAASNATDGTDGSAGTSAVGTVDISLVPATAPATVPPPSVDVPSEEPTELEVTELTGGSGREAVEGDKLLVNYVGVRFEDGEEFDDNYGGEPLVVELGAGGVIPGWEEGLTGAQSGDVLQLDIPADLAYGPTPATSADETTATGTANAAGAPTGALSFVVDVLAVVPPNDAAEAPSSTDIPTYSTDATEVLTDDVREGDGAALEMGMTAIVNVVVARADNGVVLLSTWGNADPSPMTMAPTGRMDGLVEGLVGMKVGGRRIVTVPFEQGFGPEGEPQEGLPPETDVVVIVDLIAAY